MGCRSPQKSKTQELKAEGNHMMDTAAVASAEDS